MASVGSERYSQGVRRVTIHRTTDSGLSVNLSLRFRFRSRPSPEPKHRTVASAVGRPALATGRTPRAYYCPGAASTRDLARRPIPRAGTRPMRRTRPSRDEPGVTRYDADAVGGSGTSQRTVQRERVEEPTHATSRPSVRQEGGKKPTLQTPDPRFHRTHPTFYGP